MAKKSKKPILRKGLAIEDLISDHYSYKVAFGIEKPYSDYPDTEMIVHEIVVAAVQLLIDHVDAGNEVGRREITQMMSMLSRRTAGLSDCINTKINLSTVTPTLLDKIAGA